MDRAEEPSVGSPSGESKPRTPAYASFDSSTDKLLHVFHAVLRGMQAFKDDFETKLAPEITSIATEIKQRLRVKASNQEPRDTAEMINNRYKGYRTLAEAHQPLHGRFTDGSRVDSGVTRYYRRGISRGRTDLCGKGRSRDHGIFTATANCAICGSGTGTILRGTT